VAQVDARAVMERAVALAREAAREGEVPVGAVVADEAGALFEGRNRSGAASPLLHAEMEALGAALEAKGRHGLSGCVLYVTLEPCLMCLGAMVMARIGGLVFACSEPRFGGVEILQAAWKEGRYPHRFPVASGLCEEESRGLLQEYFRARRERE
jgi:tRNA(adenine34) deaminase